MDFAQISGIRLGPKQKIKLRFRSEATFENAICVYKEEANGQLTQLFQRGNLHGRNLSDSEPIELDPKAEPKQDYLYIYIGGWHKASPGPRPDLPWVQSEKMEFQSGSGGVARVGFEDSGGTRDFNDIVAEIIYMDEHIS